MKDDTKPKAKGKKRKNPSRLNPTKKKKLVEQWDREDAEQLMEEKKKEEPKRGRGRPNKGGSRERYPHEGQWKPVFLQWFANTGNISRACSAAGINNKTAYDERKKNPVFAEEWEEARERSLDALEWIAWKRAKKNSDSLLMFLLRVHRGYRDRVGVEVTGKDGGPVQGQIRSSVEMTLEQRKAYLVHVIQSLKEQLETEQHDGATSSESLGANGVGEIAEIVSQGLNGLHGAGGTLPMLDGEGAAPDLESFTRSSNGSL